MLKAAEKRIAEWKRLLDESIAQLGKQRADWLEVVSGKNAKITALEVDIKALRSYASGQHPRQARWSAAKRSGSDGGLGLLVRLPIPWKQVGDFVGGVIWKPGQHVSEPGLRIDVVHLAGFDQGIDGGGTMAASV
jgi:hypothetical protein